MNDESSTVDSRLRLVDRHTGCLMGLLFGLLMSACLAWQLERMDQVFVFLMGGGLVGVMVGGALGLRHFNRRQNAHSSELGTTSAIVFSVIPALLQILKNLDQLGGRASILAVGGVAFAIVVIALFVGAALDRLNKNLLGK